MALLGQYRISVPIYSGGFAQVQSLQQLNMGLKDSSTDSGAAVAARRLGPASARVTNWTYLLVLAAANTPQQGPDYRVPPGCDVVLRANSGQATGNAGMVFFATYRERFASGQATPLAPLDVVKAQVTNLNQLWFYGAANDGVTISVESVASAT